MFLTLLLGASGALLATGCGAARQDKHEEKRTYTMKVVKANFPANQAVARPASLELQVENADSHTAPNVAVTLDSFYYTENFPQLAANKRPIWAIEAGPGKVPKRFVESQAVSPPGGAQTNYVSTWALGPLAPGHIQTFVWHVAPLKAGMHTVHYTVAAGLAGNARAKLASGAPVQGQFTADVAPVPPSTHVDPRTGHVVPGSAPLSP